MSLASRSFGAAAKAAAALAQLLPDGERDPLLTAAGEIGWPRTRVDGSAKVTGAVAYAADHHAPGMAHAALVGSTVARGRVTAIDATAASAVPGVLLVMTHENAPRMQRTAVFATLQGPLSAAGTGVRVLNTDEVYWRGQPVAVVVADTMEGAAFAAGLVKVAYESAPAELSLEAGMPRAFTPSNTGFEESETRIGDPETALERAAVQVDGTYTTPQVNHCAMELHATLAWWDGEDLHVRDATQYPYGVKEMLAKKFGLSKDRVHVEAPFIGGGFGGKAAAWPHVWLAVAAAKLTGRPVRLTLSRAQTFTMTGGRSPTRSRVALGADANGRLIALVHEGASMCTDDVFAEYVISPSRHLYASPGIALSQKVVRLDRIQNSFMRAPGDTPGSFALESAMDELAWAAGLDPVELRLRNEPERNPTKGTDFSSRHLLDCYALGAERFGWSKRVSQPRAMREGRTLVGYGMAACVYPVQQFTGAVRLRLDADGTATIASGHNEMGTGAATAQAQAAAERLGLPFAKVRVVHGSADMPPMRTPGGSATTATIASAVWSARDALVRELLKLAKGTESPLAGARFDDVDTGNEGLHLKNQPGHGESYRALLARAGRDAVEVTGKAALPYKATKHSMHAYGAHFCEVRVDEDTGTAHIARWVGAFDGGRIINPRTARSQLIGGIIMGLGMALQEETVLDEGTGWVANANLAEYHLPVEADVPEIEVHFLDRPDPLTPLGVKGIGELGIVGAAAAVANAVFHATGTRVRDLPIRLDKLL